MHEQPSSTTPETGLSRVADPASPPVNRRPPIHLTPRESQIVRYVMLGESNKQIARRLGISDYTVRDHVSNLLKKAGATSRSRLALLMAPVFEPVTSPFGRPLEANRAMEPASGQEAVRQAAGTRQLRGNTEY